MATIPDALLEDTPASTISCQQHLSKIWPLKSCDLCFSRTVRSSQSRSTNTTQQNDFGSQRPLKSYLMLQQTGGLCAFVALLALGARGSFFRQPTPLLSCTMYNVCLRNVQAGHT